MSDIDFLIRKNVYLKQEAAKARIALRNMCIDHSADMERWLEVAADEEDLIMEMQNLQKEAEDDAISVLGYKPN